MTDRPQNQDDVPAEKAAEPEQQPAPESREDELANLIFIAVAACAIATIDIGLPRYLPIVLGVVALPFTELLGKETTKWVTWLLWANVAVVLFVLTTGNFRAARERANTRACYANQKTIAGAVEMYNLDKMTRRSDIGTSFCLALVSGGYLQSVPNDPGQGGSQTSANYQFTPGGNGIKCSVHGTIQGNS